MAGLRMMASPSLTPLPPAPTPHRAAIPGSYGLPLIGPLVDRLNYFWFQGPNNFFKKRIEKYNSTVFRTNVPPAFPFFFGVNPKVVALLDVKSFSHLFDLDLVEKNVLVGDFMPSLNYTGGMRVCAYLDTSEAKHSQFEKIFAMKVGVGCQAITMSMGGVSETKQELIMRTCLTSSIYCLTSACFSLSLWKQHDSLAACLRGAG